ncbi:type II toxin-antitoxin system PemK/MazF family toxin [Cellulomonas hominis]
MTGTTPAQRLALWRGAVAWANLDPTRGREQSGRRPVLVVASDAYLETVTTLAIVVPVTTVDRGWPNHIRLAGLPGLDRPSWAMTEQVRTIARDLLVSVVGHTDDATLREVDVYLRDFLGF